MHLVTTKAGAKHEQIHNCHSYTGLLNKSSCLAPDLGVTKFIIVTEGEREFQIKPNFYDVDPKVSLNVDLLKPEPKSLNQSLNEPDKCRPDPPLPMNTLFKLDLLGCTVLGGHGK